MSKYPDHPQFLPVVRLDFLIVTLFAFFFSFIKISTYKFKSFFFVHFVMIHVVMIHVVMIHVVMIASTKKANRQK